MFVIKNKAGWYLPKGPDPLSLDLQPPDTASPATVRTFRNKGAAASVLAAWLKGPFTTWNEGFYDNDGKWQEGYWTQTPRPERVAEEMVVEERWLWKRWVKVGEVISWDPTYHRWQCNGGIAILGSYASLHEAMDAHPEAKIDGRTYTEFLTEIVDMVVQRGMV